jgi:hypothetical protein
MLDIFFLATGIETGLLIAAIAASVVGTGVGVYSQVKAGNDAEDAAKANAAVEKNNAIAAQQQAALEAGQVRRKNLLRMGAQRAAAGKSGVLIDDSAGDVIYDTAIQGELEALSVAYSGATQSNYYNSKSRIARWEGSQAKSAANLNAGATLIGGLGSAARMDYEAYPKMKSSSSVMAGNSGGGGIY